MPNRVTSSRPGPDAGEEQPAERFFRRDRKQDHGDRGRQQDAERAAGGDDAGGEAAGIAALAHLGNAGRADRRAGRGRGARHRREQRAGEDVGDAEPAGNAMQPGMQRRIEVLAGAGLADRRTLEDEQRDRQQRDRGHFLVDVLRHGIERGGRHVDRHEHDRDRAERERDRHAREHRDQGREPVADANAKDGHRRAAPVKGMMICSRICTHSSVMPSRHQHIGDRQRRRPHRVRHLAVDPGFMRQRPGFPGEEGAEQQAGDIDQPEPDAVGERRQQPDKGLDADMAALALHIGRGHEGGADQQEHRRLVLPVIRAVEQGAAEHAVAQDGAGRDQRDAGEDDDDVVAKRQRTLERRHERIARGDRSGFVLIRKRTMHHAETSVASFSRLAEVAVLAP